METEDISFEDLEKTDVISVELVPERKGLILKHCEYYVSSRRYGTTVTRRYNDFVQLYDVLFAKYPYRTVCRLPPKRVVVGGGSTRFLERRRAALQRWLTLVARHPMLSHDADTRVFLCETMVRLEKPRYDEFTLAGEECNVGEMSTEEMQSALVSDQEQLKIVYLGLGRLSQILDKVEGRWRAELGDVRELGAALSALSALRAPAAASQRRGLHCAAKVASEAREASEAGEAPEAESVALALAALGGLRELGARLAAGLHAERAAAAAHAPASPAAARHRYALSCALQEGRVGRAYALYALQQLPELFQTRANAHTRLASLWSDLHTALQCPSAS